MGLSRTNFAVTTLIPATPDQVFWFLADPSTAAVIDPAGGRLAAVLAARMLERNAVAQQDRVRRVLEAAVRLPTPRAE